MYDAHSIILGAITTNASPPKVESPMHNDLAGVGKLLK